MSYRHTLVIAGLVCSLATAAWATGPVYFHNVRVFDGTRVLEPTSVLIRNGRIEAIGEEIAVPNAQPIDATGKTLLPGFIDAHAHVWSKEMLEQQLVFGVTTVLDMFTSVPFAAGMRKEQGAGPVAGRADLYSAGTLITAPGGHGTEYGLKIPTLNSPADAQAFVDARIAEGSDYIKLVLDDASAYGSHRPTLSKETLAAAIAAAHKRGKLTVVHIGTLADAEEAINAGADGLAHLFVGAKSDPDFGKLVASHHAFVIPTLTVLDSICGAPGGEPLLKDSRMTPYLDAASLQSLQHGFPLPKKPSCAGAREAIKQLKAAGAPVLAGDDVPNPGTAAGATEHREMELLVDAGLTPVEALAAATSAPARIFHLDDRGVIAPGKRADVVLVNGDPTTNILDTRNIVGVWKGGELVDRESYRAEVQKAAESAKAQASAPPPTGSESGLVSDFEQDKPSSQFGAGWVISTDAIMGGKSTAKMAVAAGGAHGSKGYLDISGEVMAGSGPVSWAGAMFMPGKKMMDPANLSSKKTLSFWAKGEGRAYSIMVFTGTGGYMPATQNFSAGKEWKQVSFPLKSFSGTDGHDLMGVFFGSSAPPGKFDLCIDDVRIE